MRIRTVITAAAAGVLMVGLVPAAAADTLAGDVATLTVAPEHRAGYDRDEFGDYDRDAVLERDFGAYPGCGGYFSRYDGECYRARDTEASKERADDHVDIDHRVALAEAWDSGAYRWSAAKRDRFAGDPSNLDVMTDNLNSSKSDRDAAEWLPPRAVCGYARSYVDTKMAYDLTVDRQEKTALVELAARCGGSPRPPAEDGGGADETPPASGGGGQPADKDCGDFTTREQAQAVFDRRDDDTFRLDADSDGQACESLPAADTGGEDTAETDGAGGQVTIVPEGGVATGGGSTAGVEHAGLLGVGIAALLAMCAVAAGAMARVGRHHS